MRRKSATVEIEQVLLAERALIGFEEDELSRDWRLTDGLARYLPFLRARNHWQRQSGAKSQECLEAKASVSSHGSFFSG
jgi:hypothetical protein